MLKYHEIYEDMALRVGSSPNVTRGFVQTFLEVLKDRLEDGEDVSLLGIGTLKWVPVPERDIPPEKHLTRGVKLKFKPNANFKARRM